MRSDRSFKVLREMWKTVRKTLRNGIAAIRTPFMLSATFSIIVLLAAQSIQLVHAAPAVDSEAKGPSLSLSPAVAMFTAQPGQTATQQLSITNSTSEVLGFELEAMDVAVRDGKRVFVRAGEMPESIARTAVFSPSVVIVQPGSTATTNLTVTIPPNPSVRAMVAVFRGKTTIEGQTSVGMTASLGTLVTFTLSKQYHVESIGLKVDGTRPQDNVTVSEWVTNTGKEPVVAKGVMAILKSNGTLVGKVPIDSHRLLPEERLEIKSLYPSVLASGKYRALVTLEHDGGLLTTSSDFEVQ